MNSNKNFGQIETSGNDYQYHPLCHVSRSTHTIIRLIRRGWPVAVADEVVQTILGGPKQGGQGNV